MAVLGLALSEGDHVAMVSSEPLPDRCAANITHKLGVEITLGASDSGHDDALEVTDQSGSVVLCRFVDTADDPSHIVEVVPDYRTLRKWLWDDYVRDAVALGADVTPGAGDGDSIPTADAMRASEAVTAVDQNRPPVEEPDMTYQSKELGELEDEDMTAIEAGTATWIHIDGSAPHNVTNRYNEHVGYCERYPLSEDGKTHCNDHADKQDFAEGEHPNNGNTYGMTHGLFAQRTNYWEALDQEDRAFIEGMVNSWLEDAPFGRDHQAKFNELYRTAIDQHRAMGSLDEFVEDGEITGLTKEQTVDYDEDTKEEITSVEEHPVNLPYSRLDRDILKKLNELEILDDDDVEEEAAESIAKLLSGGA
jgi:hypothetical protein